MAKLLKEPLVHFLFGALLIFAYFWAIGSGRDPESYEIIISAADIDRIAADSIRTTNRLPTHDEIGALVDQNVREEIFYREALRLGLDDGDAVIRRRLANKMRSLNNSNIPEPNDADLQKWIDDRPDKYASSFQYEFDQIYIGRDSPATLQESQKRNQKWLQDLRTGAIDAAAIAAPLSIASKQKLANLDAIKRKFGSNFTERLSAIAVGQWAGPIESGFGLHFVKITQKIASGSPDLNDIRQQVSNDWRADQIAATEKSIYDELAAQYDIEIAPFK